MWFPFTREQDRSACVFLNIMPFTYLMKVYLPCLPPSLPPCPLNPSYDVGGCFLVLRVVVFCSVFREAAWPCSSLFILTLFKIALPLSLLSFTSSLASSLFLRKGKHISQAATVAVLSKVWCSSLWSHRLFSL